MTNKPALKPAMVSKVIQRPDYGSVPANVFVIYLILFFVIWTLRATVLIRIDDSIESPLSKNLFLNAVKFTIWVVPVLITLSIRRVRPLAYLKLTTPVNKRGLIIAVIVTLAWCVLVVAGESILSPKPGSNARREIIRMANDSPRRFSIAVLGGNIVQRIHSEPVERELDFLEVESDLGLSVRACSCAVLGIEERLLGAGHKRPGQRFRARVAVRLVDEKTNSLWPVIGAHIANNFLSGVIHG